MGLVSGGRGSSVSRAAPGQTESMGEAVRSVEGNQGIALGEEATRHPSGNPRGQLFPLFFPLVPAASVLC